MSCINEYVFNIVNVEVIGEVAAYSVADFLWRKLEKILPISVLLRAVPLSRIILNCMTIEIVCKVTIMVGFPLLAIASGIHIFFVFS